MHRFYLSRVFKLICIVHLLIMNSLLAVPGELRNSEIKPVRVSTPPQIDGSLNDEAWQHSPIHEPFLTYNPTHGEHLPQETFVFLAYDDNNLFFAFRCLDTEPEKIKTSITQRDHMFSDDWVGLSLDGLGNRQSAYDLFVNPNGIQGDILNSAVRGEDLSPDFVWQSAGRITEDGYQVEIKLPLRSIRFKSGSRVSMGILFWRRISRLGTSGSWPEIKPGVGLFNVHAPVVYEDLKRPLTLEVLPSFTYGTISDRETENAWSKNDVSKEFGVGLKYGLTSSVTAEATYNPDFSQVESDAFQVEVNRRYPIFYSEKRPFFMEGVDIFSFAIISHGMMLTPVHTRNIVDPQWGSKLTGTFGKMAFGVLAAGDEYPGYAWNGEVNPHEGKKATFAIVRGKYGLGGDNYVGGLYSGREFADRDNHVIGGDVQFRFLRNHQTTFSVLHSQTSESGGQSQQGGVGVNWTYGYSTRTFGASAAFEHYDDTFEMASAFLMRKGIDRGWIFINSSFYPNPEKWFWFRRIGPEFIYAHVYDHHTKKHDSYISVSLNANFTKQGNFRMEYAIDNEYWMGTTFHKNSISTSGGLQLTKWLNIGGHASWREAIYYWGDPTYLGYGYTGGFNFNLQPNAKFSLAFGYYREDFKRSSDDAFIYDINIFNARATYQFNKYFFIRTIFQYDSYNEKLLTDFLASFTFIPGTVIHLGYGSLYEKGDWHENQWVARGNRLFEMRRSLFFKASYLWRY